MRTLEQAAQDAGATEFILHSQMPAIGFYERLGYEPYGEIEDDGGQPHHFAE